jgi:hypothetical protein
MDLDFLNPPPPPETLHFNEMELHQAQLSKSGIKIALSPELQKKLYILWSQVKDPQHQDFLRQILTQNLVSHNFPSDLVIETNQVHLEPPFLPSEPDEWVALWLHSLMACYRDEQFNTGGALLATWSRDEFAGRQDVQVTYQETVEKLPITRDEAEWDALLAELDRPPLPFTANLCVYADESGSGDDEWIAVVVISEQQANEIGRAAITAYNQSQHPGNRDIREIHFSKLSQHGAKRREPAQRKLAEHVVEGLCDARIACFIVTKRPDESKIDLYARGLRETLRAWKPNLIRPIHIDTPYDLQKNHVQNRNLCGRVQGAIHSEDLDLASADIILGKSKEYPGLGIADAIAYIRRRRYEKSWKKLWQQLVDANCIKREA